MGDGLCISKKYFQRRSDGTAFPFRDIIPSDPNWQWPKFGTLVQIVGRVDEWFGASFLLRP